MEQEGGRERVNGETAKRDGKRSNLDIWIRMVRVIRRTEWRIRRQIPSRRRNSGGYFAQPNTTRAARA